MKRITIYDVAKEADVSLATVSRVINKLLKNWDINQMRLRKD